MVPMKSTYRRWSAAAGTLTVLAMGGLTVACGSQGNNAPTTVTVTPSIESFMRLSERKNVLLPHPLGPTSTTSSPSTRTCSPPPGGC